MYDFKYARTIVYMLQSTEYAPRPYIKWLWRTKNFHTVMHRRTLEMTRPARMLLLAMRLGILAEIIIGLVLICLDVSHHLAGGIEFGVTLIVVYPMVWSHLIVVPLILGKNFVSKPKANQLSIQAEKIFAEHPGIKVAVAGSYGKTTMKELLKTVLSDVFEVAATPANKNVSVSHAQFARSLTGTEDVLIIEYGEGAPGDVSGFAQVTHPTHAVITGLAPAHLDQYKTLEAAGDDIFSVANFVESNRVYVYDGEKSVMPFIKPDFETFDANGALGWKTHSILVSIEGTTFKMTKGKEILNIKSGLVGKHQVGYLAFVAAYGLLLGMKASQVEAAMAVTQPFAHRMQPYTISGAWVIDDTYNGNLEGIRAGTEVLNDLEAKRKIYVTPGLVDQGKETGRVHREMGKLIATAKPDMVVLMKNSVTNYIQTGLNRAGYKGELRIEEDPLDFYTNLPQFVATGDLVVMQNDWPDNYY
jgi:UDP-N-acetylmuramoyl-tripeptide--D-alanyl-D-alanine ligase